MTWFALLPLVIALELLAFPLAFILPLFEVSREGKRNNANGYGVASRLPTWLAWFDTPDNDLLGDDGHIARHKGSSRYWQMVSWLLRNRCYGFKWGMLAVKVDEPIEWSGNRFVNRNHSEGTLKCKMVDYWQWKYVKRIPKTDKCIMLNFGWLLDAYIGNETGQFALYQLSPRLAKFEPVVSGESSLY